MKITSLATSISSMAIIKSFHVFSPKMNIKHVFPFYPQFDMMDCGPACLRMIAKHCGKHYTLQTLRKKCFITYEGVSMLGISEATESIGFHSLGVRLDTDRLVEMLYFQVFFTGIKTILSFSTKSRRNRMENIYFIL